MNISSSDAIIQISGLDSAEFLQGQITNDVNLASSDQMLRSAICNVKGRVLAVFKILKVSTDFHIFLNKSIAEKFKSHLEKYSVFYKTKIELINQSSKNIEIISESDFRLRCIEEGFVDINEPISESFTPHELNYQNLGLINFEKGCFTGQEVIARMHYRGKLKFGLAKYRIGAENFLCERDYVYNKDNKRIGQIVSKEKDTGLIALKDASLISERLFKEDLEKIEFLTIESM
ncbi:MAG: YgfZ/GcvT domain-containing protein [Gammaproteobacteria bacterium]|jgi:folate-binding protein YgfZ